MALDALSALLDGECSKEELDRVLADLERSPELARQWSRLCLARDAREGVSVESGQPCICADVMSRLDDAPAPADARVVEMAAHRAHREAAAAAPPSVRSVFAWRPLVGFAAAASVGAAAVFFLQPKEGAGIGEPGRPVGIPVAGTLANWNTGTVTAVQPVALSEDEAHAEMLREYLIDHSSAVAGESLGGTLRYARFAAHTVQYRPEPVSQP